MKKSISLIALTSMLAAASLSSCLDDNYEFAGEGTLKITATINSDVRVESRVSTEEELSESCLIWISSQKGLVRKYEGISSLPTEGVKLTSGSYVAEAWAGDSVSASFTDKYFYGCEPFEITNGQTSEVNLTCKIANVVTSINYDDAVDGVIKDYYFVIGHSRGDLTFEGRDDRKGYFMMPSTDTDLTWTLTATTLKGEQYVKTGTIANAKKATEYAVHVKYNEGTPDAIGGGYLTIEVDETAIEVEDQIVIALAPQIAGVGFNITDPVMGEPDEVGRTSVYISAAAALSSVVVDFPRLTELIPSLGGNDFDALSASSNVVTALNNNGINWKYTYDNDLDVSNLKLNFESEFIVLLAGEYPVTITATDANGKTTTTVLTLNITRDPVITSPLNENTVYATRATLEATVADPTQTGLGFNYRALNASRADGEWQFITGTVNGKRMTAVVTGLAPNTTYQYYAVTSGFSSPKIMTFTTEDAPQLPNAGFENWQLNKTYLLHSASEEMFWDSGNHGSSTMNKNVTVPDESIKHSGKYSVKLESQFVGLGVIGAFAAGNVFVGSFLGTEDTTKGILGWGRPFTGRPTALKGYIKYTPQAVTYSSTSLKSKGEMDEGIVYIALMDDNTETYGSYGPWPVIVRTKGPHLFDPESSHVIAYGQLVLTEATAGSGLVEFNIPLTYRRTDVKPSNIIITASASRYGDYYTGGPSTMWLDDLELVY